MKYVNRYLTYEVSNLNWINSKKVRMLASKDKLANSSELFTLSQVSALTSISHLNAIPFYKLL